MSFTMRINICLVKASQFFRQFCLILRHPPGKKQIIPDALNKLANANNAGYNA